MTDALAFWETKLACETDPADVYAAEVVVMCWSLGCNAATKAARELAALGYRVREMIGGYEYWRREGFPAESDAGPLPRIHDPLVAVVPGA